MKILNKIFMFLLILLLYVTTFYSSDSFILDLQEAVNIYYNKVFTWIDLLIIIILIIGIIIILKNKSKSVKSTDFYSINIRRIFILSVLFFTFLVFGMIVSIERGVHLDHSQMLMSKYRYYLYSIFIMMIIYNLKCNVKQLKLLLNAFIVFNYLKSLIGIYGYIKGTSFDFLVLGKVVFSEGDILLNITFALAFSLAFFIMSKKKVSKLIYLNFIVTFLFVVTISMRRTTLLGVLVIIFINLLMLNLSQKIKIVFLSISILTIMACMLSVFNFEGSNFSLENLSYRIQGLNIFSNYKSDNSLQSDNGHIDDILDAIDNVKQNPVLGRGLYTPVIRNRVSWQASLTYFHNGFLAAWVQAGILGMLVYLLYFIFIIKLIISKLIYDKNSKYVAYYVALLSIVVAHIIQSNVAGAFYDIPVLTINFNILMALVLNIMRLDAESISLK